MQQQRLDLNSTIVLLLPDPKWFLVFKPLHSTTYPPGGAPRVSHQALPGRACLLLSNLLGLGQRLRLI